MLLTIIGVYILNSIFLLLMGIICAFGDSLVWGAWDQELGGWVNRLRLWFDSFDDSDESYHFVYNSGIAGDNTRNLLSRIESECAARSPDIIIIGIGSNDSANEDNEISVPLEEFGDNLQSIITSAKEFCDHVVFLSLGPVNESQTSPVEWDSSLSYSNKRIKEYGAALAEVCKSNNVPIIDITDVLKDSELPDGLHFSPAGHEAIFQKVKTFLEEKFWLEEN
jgi:lysophospholipase L1-like esterase